MKKLITILAVVLAICICGVMSVSAAELSDQENGKWIAQQAENMTFPTDGSSHVAVCPVCCKSVTWYAVTEAQMTEGKSLSAGYHYYVADSVDLATGKTLISGTIKTGQSCCLHLNGKTLLNQNGAVLSGSSGSINVMGKGLLKGGMTGDNLAKEGATAYVQSANDSASMNLYGGTYEKYDPTTTANVLCVRGNGGRIRMYDGAIVNVGTAGSAVYIKNGLVFTNGVFEMYGGTIDNSTSSENAVDIEAVADNRYVGSFFYMYGGTIKCAKIAGATARGVVVRKNVTFNMYGGTIQDGTATDGGNVYVVAGGTFNMYGGTITGGTATNGGNVYVATSAKASMYGGEITNGVATSGGNVYLPLAETEAAGAVFNMYGGTISGTRDENGNALGGKATNGGNVYVAKYGAFNMYGGTVKDGTATNEGGNFYIYGESPTTHAKLYLKNATVSGGKSTSNGGNIVVNRSSLTIEDGTEILDGYAGGRAGSILLYIGKVVMNGGRIAGGNAKTGNVDNIWAYGVSDTYPGSFYMLGGVIEATDDAHNTGISAAKYGRVYLGGDATVTDPNPGYAAINMGASSNIYSKLFVCDGWTGSADVYFLDHGCQIGETISTTYGQVVKLKPDLTDTAGGSFTGTLTQRHTGSGQLVAGEGGKLVASNIQTAMVAADGSVVTVADILTEWDTGNYIYVKLTGNTTIEDLGGYELTVDLNGFNLTVGGTGTLNAFDTTGDATRIIKETVNEVTTTRETYKAPAGKIVFADGANVVVTQDLQQAPNGNRYIAVTAENGNVSMHRLSIRLTAVTLRPTSAGLYYKAMCVCDDTLAAMVKYYGVVVSLVDMPGANFMADWYENRYTTCTGTGFKSGVVTTSGSVFGIMKNDRDTLLNDQYGQMSIYANPYIVLTQNNTVLVGDNRNEGKTVADADFTGAAYSLRDALKLMDGIFYNYNLSSRIAINQFFKTWQTKGMDWDFDHIDEGTVVADNKNLSVGADNKAVCPVCNESVTWKAVTQAANGTTALGALNDGDHYYLAEDITYTGTDTYFVRAPVTGSSACLHLNGHNLTTTNTQAIFGYAGVLNVMGNGTVMGNTATENNGAAVHINTGGANGKINLYGGTYTKPVSNKTASVITSLSGGTVNLYEGVTVRTYTDSYAIYTGKPTNANITIGIHGAQVIGGQVRCAAPGTTGVTLNISGNAKITDVVIASTYINVNLSGAPVIERMATYYGQKLNLGALSQGADIAVSTREVFTNPCDNIMQYAQYFRPWVETDKITVLDDNTLCYDINYELYTAPWDYDVSAGAIADGKIHYYFMATEGMITSPTSAEEIDTWGDSCLIVFPNGETMLVDSGYAVQGEQIALSLQKMGVNKLDYLLITHPHSDHIGGAFGSSSPFLDMIEVEQVYHNRLVATGDDETYWIENTCAARNIPQQNLERNMVLYFGDVKMEVLWPMEGTSEKTISSGQINDQSMVFRLDHGEHSSLFTADLYVAGEEALMAATDAAKLDVDFLKIPHHGWNTSSSKAFIDAVTAQIAVATGRKPFPETTRTNYVKHGKVLTDFYNGFIHVSADAEGNMEYETTR